MDNSRLFPKNSVLDEPNLRGTVPNLMEELHLDVVFGAMVAGVKTVDVDSAFGLGVGEVLGIIPFKTREAANLGLVYSVAASSTAGKVTITQNSTSNASTTNVTNSFYLIGRAYPVSE